MSATDSEWEKRVWELEELLHQHGIGVVPGGAFEKAALTLTELEEFGKNPASCDCTTDPREKWRQAMSLADLAEKILYVKQMPGFEQLIPHLKLLAGMADLSQFSTTLKENQDNNKIFELYVAAMALPFLTNLSVDHPDQSTGTNPDVLGIFNGKTWGIACKAMHSTHPKTFCERVAEAVDQIQVSSADRGLVVMNMKNTFDHDALWPAKKIDGEYHLGHLQTEGNVLARLLPIYEKVQAGAFAEFGSESEFYQNLFKGKKAAPYVLLIFSTVCGLPGPVFVPVKTINCLCLPPDPEAEELANKLNMALGNCAGDPPIPGEDQPG